MKKLRQGSAVFAATIAEMNNSIESDIDIKVDTKKIEGLLSRDKNPMFVTLMIAREGVSKNRRNYTPEVIDSIAEQINSNHPDAYSGHLSDADRATKNPDVETIWLGATVKEIDGKKTLYAKGYVMPSAKKRREYLETAKDLGKNVAVSIYGTAKEAIYNAKLQAYDIKELVLESVDWARSGSAGIANDGTLILTSEMVNLNGNKENNDMDKVQAIKETTISEMKEHNPELVTEIESGVAAVAEMTSVRTALGIDEKADVATTVSEMAQKIRSHELTDELNSRVKSPAARPIIKQMVLSEMKDDATVKDTVEKVLQSDDAKAIIKETAGVPKVQPKNDERSQATARKFTKESK
jgi:hypothetical protein